jgi:acyl-CoA thioesterase FadM
MYPFIRLATELVLSRSLPPLGLTGTHVSHHTCLPWDIDPWRELNNGRTLTLYDLGRIPHGRRIGLEAALRANRWGMAVAGASVRYRRRIRAFDRVEMHTRGLGWDARFLYIEQSLWKRGEAANHILIRSAITSAEGIVDPARLARALGADGQSPPLPHWVTTWIEAEGERPWPPDRPAPVSIED